MQRQYILTPRDFAELLLLVDAKAAQTSSTQRKSFLACGVSDSTRKRWMADHNAGRDVTVDVDNMDKLGKHLLQSDANALMGMLRTPAGSGAPGQPPLTAELSELKSVIPRQQSALRDSLLSQHSQLPTFLRVLQALHYVSVSDSDKADSGNGADDYLHMVQVSVVLVVEQQSRRSALYTYRRKSADAKQHSHTLGGSLLFSKALIWNHKQVRTPLDAWLHDSQASRETAISNMLRGRGNERPVALQLLQARLLIPRYARLVTVQPRWVIANDQRGVVRHDGRVMSTVYTSFAFFAEVNIPRNINYSPVDFAAPGDPRNIDQMSLDCDDAELRRVLSTSKSGKDSVNGMDYAVALDLQGRLSSNRLQEGNGVVTIRGPFGIA